MGAHGGSGGNIIVKTDGEASIVALREALAKYHGGVVTPETPPTGESQAHGSAEENGRRLRGMIKVYLNQLEERASVKLQATDPILQWLIRWAAMAYSRFKLGEDGRTAYERQKGRRCCLEVVPFGELVRYKQLGETSQERKSLETIWFEGVWLGHARGSSEALVGTAEGVVRAWTIRRLPEAERWDAESITEMQGTPAQPNPTAPGLHIPIAINIDQGGNSSGAPVETAQRKEEQTARRVYLKQTDFEQHGYSGDCEGCARLQAGMGPRPHSEACRTRLEEELGKGSGGNRRWQAAQDRQLARSATNAALEEMREKKRRLDKSENAQVPNDDPVEKATADPVEPSSSKDHIKRRPVEQTSEEEDDNDDYDDKSRDKSKSKKIRRSTPTGQKRKDLDVEVKEFQAKAKSKSTIPSGEKRTVASDVARSPGKAKIAEATGETRKVESDVEDLVLQGSPMRTKLQEDEDMVDRLNTISSQSAIHVLQLHEGSKLTEDQEKHNIHTMDLGDLNIDELDNREKVATWVREMKPACIIGSSKGKSRDHISWCCSLYKLQVGEGRMFVHEHGMGSPDKCLREVGKCLDFALVR